MTLVTYQPIPLKDEDQFIELNVGETNMRPMKPALFSVLLFSVLLCGCGGSSKSTPAAMTPTNWVGTWSGQVDWTGAAPNSGDNVTITIAAPVTSVDACGSGENTYTSQFTGTDTGGQCAPNGPVSLSGAVVTCDGSYGLVNGIPTGTSGVVTNFVTNFGYSSCETSNQGGVWSVTANSITITGYAPLGTLTKQ